MSIWISRELPLFIFERLDKSWASHKQTSQKLWPFEFAESSCWVSSISIYYAPESDIWVKCYNHLNLSRASVVHFQASWYIMVLTHTPKSKVMAVGIYRELPCSVSSVSIYYAAELDIQMKCYDHLNFSRASVAHFRASRYIMGLTHTPESKVMVVWICRELPLFNF